MMQFPDTPYVLLEDSKSASRSDAGLMFSNPERILSCHDLNDVAETLEKIEFYRAKGFYLAGWISYEAAYPLHPTLKTIKPRLSPEPLIWMGVFKAPKVLSSDDLDRLFLNEQKRSPQAGLRRKPEPGETKAAFEKAFKKIIRYIGAGDVYQINHTFRLGLETFGPARNLFAMLRRNQPVPFGALIETGTWQILSLSPELFITRQGRTLTSRPMKGTAKPGRTLDETKENMEKLGESGKDRAENVMITDLIRNDFSKVCEPKSVKVPKLFDVEQFSRVLQMSSEVRGTLNPKTTFLDIFSALFPCGSITGAPKIRAMEIIHETEQNPRGLYTGAVGYIAPSGDFTFSVPIRTAVIEKTGKGWLGVGSGIVEASNLAGEYNECLLKGRFLEDKPRDFGLIETMAWRPGEGIIYLDEHLDRIHNSALYFGLECDPVYIKSQIEGLVKGFSGKNPQRIRMVLGKTGGLSFESRKLPSRRRKEPVPLKLSETRVESANMFLFHKTTERHLYDRELADARAEGFYDVLFLNEKGEVTEGAFNTVFVDNGNGKLVTPHLDCGVLPGVLRRNLIESGKVTEVSLTFDDLARAKTLVVGNSVTGLLQATLKTTP